MAKLLAFDPGKNKMILCGNVIGDSLFRNVEAKHFMRVVQGYGIQEVAFQKIAEEGIKHIVLKETHTKHQWRATVSTWIEHGRVADYGHGKQRFLSLKFMSSHNLARKKAQEEFEKKEKIRAKVINERLFDD